MKNTHEHFMQQALDEARKALRSKEFPVGCVLVHDNRIIARGRRIHSGPSGRNELDHAEIIALHDLITGHPGINPGQVIAYCTMEPCLMCYAALLLSGIGTIVYAYEDAMGGGTGLLLGHLTPLYREAKIEIISHVLRQESLQLFRQFFLDPENNYWQGSYLAEYTLRQP